MFDLIFDAIAGVMAWFYSLIADYTFAISMLTLAIMLVFTPLTLRGARSMTKMQELQPEITRLRKQHAGDRQKMNEEMMRLYQARGVSPLGGCLPNLVQIPIFIVLYRVIWNLRIPDNNASLPLDSRHPRNLSTDSQLYQDLVEAGGEMRSLGMDLAKSAYDVAIRTDFIDGLPYLGLVGVTFVLAFLQQRQMARRRSGNALPNRQMEIMMKYLPFMLPFFSFVVPAALVPYFIVSSIYRMLQQWFIHATMKPAEPLLDQAQGNGKAGPEGAGPRQSESVIEAEAVEEAAPPRREARAPVANQRSRKALNAEAARQAERERRSAERRGEREAPPGVQPLSDPDDSHDSGSDDSGSDSETPAPVVRRTRAAAPPPAPKRQRRSDSSSGRSRARKPAAERANGNSNSNGRRRRNAKTEAPQSQPIQSRRTSGDGRTRNRRKR